MRSQIKSVAMNALKGAGWFPTPITPKTRVESLLKSLYPRRFHKGLIRFGPQSDGGYLVPDDLESIAACFSPGVSNIVGFEMECAKRGMQVFLADASVENTPYSHPNFHFVKRFVGSFDRDETMSFDNWVASARLAESDDLILQMDIEGAEYEVLLSMSSANIKRFRIIVIELHLLDQLFNSAFFRLAESALAKLLATHACVHLHPNNVRAPLLYMGLKIPPFMEATFIRRDRLGETIYETTFPNQNDFDNTEMPTFRLPECWYMSSGCPS